MLEITCKAGNFCTLEVMSVKDGARPIFFLCLFGFFSPFWNLSSFDPHSLAFVCVRGSELSLIPLNLPFTHIFPSTLLSSVSRGSLVPAVPQQQWEPRGCCSLCSARLDSTHATQSFWLLLLQNEAPLWVPLKFITPPVYYRHSKVDGFPLFVVQVRCRYRILYLVLIEFVLLP